MTQLKFMNRKQNFIDRNLRLTAHPGLYSCAVCSSPLGDNQNPRWAQYADISETGMKLISTKPHDTEVGSIISLKFSLVGGEREVIKKARVVREENEYVLGLQFLNTSEEFKYVLWQHARFVSHLSWTWPIEALKDWWRDHKIGLRIAVAATVFFTLTTSLIYLFSDEMAGRKRPWGEVYPDQIDYEYVKHFRYQNDTSAEKRSE